MTYLVVRVARERRREELPRKTGRSEKSALELERDVCHEARKLHLNTVVKMNTARIFDAPDTPCKRSGVQG